MRLRIAADHVDVWHASLSALPDLRAVLSPDELDRAARFHFENDSWHFIAARGWLRTVLARYLDTSPADLRFDYGARGAMSLKMGIGIDHRGIMEYYGYEKVVTIREKAGFGFVEDFFFSQKGFFQLAETDSY